MWDEFKGVEVVVTPGGVWVDVEDVLGELREVVEGPEFEEMHPAPMTRSTIRTTEATGFMLSPENNLG
ncbi:MAG: hypothetical protein ABGW50_07755 [Thermococcus sp.]